MRNKTGRRGASTPLLSPGYHGFWKEQEPERRSLPTTFPTPFCFSLAGERHQTRGAERSEGPVVLEISALCAYVSESLDTREVKLKPHARSINKRTGADKRLSPLKRGTVAQKLLPSNLGCTGAGRCYWTNHSFTRERGRDPPCRPAANL